MSVFNSINLDDEEHVNGCCVRKQPLFVILMKRKEAETTFLFKIRSKENKNKQRRAE